MKHSEVDSISPELVAQLVKEYVLPMFESDGKKQLKNKYKKLSGSNFTADMRNPNSVYGELKLSEKLSNELNSIRDIVNALQENLEEERFEKHTYYEEIQKLKEDLKNKDKQF